MDILGKVVQMMTKEEVRAFKLFSQKMEMKEGRKDLELFDLIRKGGEDYNEAEIIQKIYPDKPRNTYHRLRSRLLNEVNESLVHLHLHSNDTLKLYHLLSTADLFFKNNQYELAHYYLKKGEKQAKKLDHYEVLDIIYNEYIKLSRWVLEINPEEYMALRRANYESLTQLRELDDIVATVVYRVRITQNYAAREGSVIQILQKTLDDFAVRSEGNLSPRMRLRIYELITLILLEKRDYEALQDYLGETYRLFEQDGIFTKATHDTRLQMLTYLINSLFKNKEYVKSLQMADVLGQEINAYDGILYEKYLFFWYNAMVINYFESDLDKALEILAEMKENPVIRKNHYYFLFVHMNEAIGFYNKGNNKAAIKAIVRSNLLEGFHSASPGLKLKIGVAEMMIRYRLDEFEVIASRTHQLRSDYEEILKDPAYGREKGMLHLILKLNNVIDPRKDPAIKKEVASFIARFPKEAEDAEIIDYDEFLMDIIKGGR